MGNWVWEEGRDSQRAPAGGAVFIIILLAVLLAGGARLALFPPSANTTRVASLSRTTITQPEVSRAAWEHAGQDKASATELEQIRRWYRAVDDDLLTRTEDEAQVAWQYFKIQEVPPAKEIAGDGKLHSLDTPYGRLSSVICFAGDFPRLLAQAGALGADVVLDSANDWRGIDPWHTQMASFRAVEQGFNLIRHASDGLSAAFDYQGRRLAAMDDFQATDRTLISQIPTKGVHTIYSRLGDWFVWLCQAGVVILMVKAMGSPLASRTRIHEQRK